MKLRYPDGVDKESSFLDGHFSGHPIVPGAILLALAVDALRVQGINTCTLKRAKFVRKLLPQIPFEIDYSVTDTHVTVVWTGPEGTIAEARFALAGNDG
jgi:3-hydroxymyristoyl/3-hydroxydecanoyl-(acyl carrier protein) dehydratase